MTNIISLIITCLLLSSCNIEKTIATYDNTNDTKVWAFIHFNVPEEGDKIDSFYYYGKISETLYKGIKSNNVKTGFILLSDVKYWGNDDIIHEYASREHKGELTFRIEDIRRIKLMNQAPIAGVGSEQFEKKEKTTP